MSSKRQEAAPVVMLPTAAAAPVQNPARRGRWSGNVAYFKAHQLKRATREAQGRASLAEGSLPDAEALPSHFRELVAHVLFECRMVAKLADLALEAAEELHSQLGQED